MSRDVHVWRLSLEAASMRSILARYLDRDARSLEFAYGPYGKPRLVDGDGLEFSWGRSGGVGVLAVAQGGEVGIDVERIDPRRALGPIADQLFATTRPPSCARWRKRAGSGVSSSSGRRRRRTGRRSAPGFLCRCAACRAPGGLVSARPQLGPGFAGALCVRGSRLRIHMHE